MKQPAHNGQPLHLFLCPPPDKQPAATSLQRAVHRTLEVQSSFNTSTKIHTPFAERDNTRDKMSWKRVVAGRERKRRRETLARHSLVSRDHKLGNLRAPPDPDTIPRHYFHGQRQFLVALSFPWLTAIVAAAQTRLALSIRTRFTLRETISDYFREIRAVESRIRSIETMLTSRKFQLMQDFMVNGFYG